MIVTNNAINNIQDTELPIGALAYFSTGGTDTTYMNQWLKCDGATYSQSNYPVLFSRLGLINNNAVIWNNVTFTTTPNVDYITSLAYGNGVYCGINKAYTFTSTDANSWTKSVKFGTTMTTVIYANSLFVAAGNGGAVYTSTDANTWTSRTTGGALNFTAITYGGGLYVIGSTTGSIQTSTNGVTWSAAVVPSANSVYALIYANSLYVGCFGTGNIYTSTDTVTWALRTGTINTLTLYCMAYGNGLLVAAGANGCVATSTNSTTWALATTTFGTYTFSSMTYGAGKFVSGQSGGTIKTSTNGSIWYNSVTPPVAANILSQSVTSLLYANNIYLSGGSSMWASNDSYPYNPATQFQVPLDNQTSCFQQSVEAFPRSLYIRALT